MQFLEEEILEITETTWSSMLGLAIEPHPCSSFSCEEDKLLVGLVDISGAWEGTVIFHGTDELARSAASQIFSILPEKVQVQDQLDAMYELSNIISGNIKSLLPEPCQLALPKVVRGSEVVSEMSGANCVSKLHFECHGQSLLVMIWKRDQS